jgi:hypothetical protein
MNQLIKKKFFVTTVSLLGLIASSSVRADGASHGGNGGGAEYCPNPIGNQLKMQAYDLAEYRGPWGVTAVDPSLKLNIPYYDGISTKKQYLDRAVEKVAKLNKPYADAISRVLTMIDKEATDKGELSLVPDANIIFNAKGCHYYQLVNWIDDENDMKNHGLKDNHVGYIFRDNDAYLSMDFMSQAANDFHEAVYKVQRAFHLQDASGSTYIRRFTAQVFSNNDLDPSLLLKLEKFGKIEKYENFHSDSSYQEFHLNFYLDTFCAEADMMDGTLTLTKHGNKHIGVMGENTNVKTTSLKEDRPLNLPLNKSGFLYYFLDVRFPGSGTVDAAVSACGQSVDTNIELSDQDQYLIINVIPAPI